MKCIANLIRVVCGSVNVIANVSTREYTFTIHAVYVIGKWKRPNTKGNSLMLR